MVGCFGWFIAVVCFVFVVVAVVVGNFCKFWLVAVVVIVNLSWFYLLF